MVNFVPSRPYLLSADNGQCVMRREGLFTSYKLKSLDVTFSRHSPCAVRFGVGSRYTWNIAAIFQSKKSTQPCTAWIKNQDNLTLIDLGLHDARDVAQNQSLCRLTIVISTSTPSEQLPENWRKPRTSLYEGWMADTGLDLNIHLTKFVPHNIHVLTK